MSLQVDLDAKLVPTEIRLKQIVMVQHDLENENIFAIDASAIYY